MLTQKDLLAIDNLVQKRVEASERRLMVHVDKRIDKTENKLKNYFTKLFNFLDKEIVSIKARIKKLEDKSSYI